MDNKKYLAIGEAAEAMGVSIDTLRRWDAEGKFRPAYISPGKHRYYRKLDIDLYLNDIFALAEVWAVSPRAEQPAAGFYCQLKPVFQTRLERLQEELRRIPEFQETYSLVVGVIAEIGNNSFDHNIGNWPDIQGIFFGYDLNKRKIALADRGRGILTTLQSVRPTLQNHADALNVAFTEVLTGRAPENRGNGLKYVRGIVTETRHMELDFRSGDAMLHIAEGGSSPKISTSSPSVQGCLALLNY